MVVLIDILKRPSSLLIHLNIYGEFTVGKRAVIVPHIVTESCIRNVCEVNHINSGE